MGLLDSDEDGRDDRIIGEFVVPGMGAASGLALSERGDYLFVGDQLLNKVYVVQVRNALGLRVVSFNESFPGSNLNGLDYYPRLGSKTVRVEALNEDGTLGAGDVTVTFSEHRLTAGVWNLTGSSAT